MTFGCTFQTRVKNKREVLFLQFITSTHSLKQHVLNKFQLSIYYTYGTGGVVVQSDNRYYISLVWINFCGVFSTVNFPKYPNGLANATSA